jgi:type II secretory ATPase GspE/PulE/Tfp pilus assembly ATPase PilB-like protein
VEVRTQEFMQVARPKLPDEILAERNYDSIFEAAQDNRASDIYIKIDKDPETWERLMVIEFGVNGEKIPYRTESGLGPISDLTNRLKYLSGCNLASMTTCQDRAFELKLTRTRYRLNLMPGVFGECFTIRQIPEGLPTLKDCNLKEETERDYVWALRQRQGLILVTGPTGHGKSTTLQAGIMQIDRKRKEVLSLEDPVERIMPNVKQVPITAEVPWHAGIRAALRSAPHVILIGEIRDEESAALAVEAAQTGHLVLSTLHTNSAAGTVDRLIEMGVRRSVLADCVLFITGQRLLKKICPECREPGTIGFVRGEGCPACNGGISGRIPLVEYTKRPSRKSILEFDLHNFERDELTVSFKSETLRLVEAGIVDELELEAFE